jgi:hypothetical protein
MATKFEVAIEELRTLVKDNDDHVVLDFTDLSGPELVTKKAAVRHLVENEGYVLFYHKLVQKDTGKEITLKSLNVSGSTFVDTNNILKERLS